MITNDSQNNIMLTIINKVKKSDYDLFELYLSYIKTLSKKDNVQNIKVIYSLKKDLLYCDTSSSIIDFDIFNITELSLNINEFEKLLKLELNKRYDEYLQMILTNNENELFIFDLTLTKIFSKYFSFFLDVDIKTCDKGYITFYETFSKTIFNKYQNEPQKFENIIQEIDTSDIITQHVLQDNILRIFWKFVDNSKLLDFAMKLNYHYDDISYFKLLKYINENYTNQQDKIDLLNRINVA